MEQKRKLVDRIWETYITENKANGANVKGFLDIEDLAFSLLVQLRSERLLKPLTKTHVKDLQFTILDRPAFSKAGEEQEMDTFLAALDKCLKNKVPYRRTGYKQVLEMFVEDLGGISVAEHKIEGTNDATYEFLY